MAYDDAKIDAVAKHLPDPFEMPMDEWLGFDQAAQEIAIAMLRFDAFVANEQGSCDTGTMKSMLTQARRYYEAVGG